MKKFIILVIIFLSIPIVVLSKNKEIVLTKSDLKRLNINNSVSEVDELLDSDMDSIKIKLSEELSHKYNIYYRTYTYKYGWNGWAKNGELAGINNYKIDKLEVVIHNKFDITNNMVRNENKYIKYPKYRPVYYKQKDKRWKSKEYGDYKMGSTGCAPTAMAMAFSGILDKVVLPVSVADYLYERTKEFDRKTGGTSGKAINLASKHFNIKATPLKNKKEIKKALIQGKIVYAAMGRGIFGTKKYNHAIIFFGYRKGYTKVYDPLTKKKNIKITIDKLWKQQSKDYDDHIGISNFYSLER